MATALFSTALAKGVLQDNIAARIPWAGTVAFWLGESLGLTFDIVGTLTGPSLNKYSCKPEWSSTREVLAEALLCAGRSEEKKKVCSV